MDLGGLRNQFFSDLSKSLLDGSDSRIIHMKSEIPEIQNIDNSEEIEILGYLGMFFSECFRNQNAITGRIFPDNYFSLLKSLIPICNEKLNDVDFLTCAKKIAIQEEIPLFDFLLQDNTVVALSDELHDLIFNILMLCNESDDLDIHDIKTLVFSHLLDCYKKRIISAQIVARNISKNLLDDFMLTDEVSLSEKIQGQPFSRDEIVSRIFYSGQNPVIKEKITWLKEFIREKDEEWVKSLIFTITGHRAIIASTKITLKESKDSLCRTRTCFQDIEILITHTDLGTEVQQDRNAPPVDNKTKFLNMLTMNESGFETK